MSEFGALNHRAESGRAGDGRSRRADGGRAAGSSAARRERGGVSSRRTAGKVALRHVARCRVASRIAAEHHGAAAHGRTHGPASTARHTPFRTVERAAAACGRRDAANLDAQLTPKRSC
ncbi:hypothetical protein C7S17_4801 [Burkholderia thailandensis]|nr:hypothetical protein [Burkholderia thailandensis]